jgi:hypothetical protein
LKKNNIIITLVLFTSILTSCGQSDKQKQPANLGQQSPTKVGVRILNLDAALTLVPTPTPFPVISTFTPIKIPTATIEISQNLDSSKQIPTKTPACTNRATFLAHLTISDNTALEAGQQFAKLWRLQNTGTCTWTTGYSLRFYSGESLNGPEEIFLPNQVRPGESIDLRADLVAPNNMNTYVGNWILSDEAGELFGVGDDSNQPISVVIQVKPTPKPSPG